MPYDMLSALDRWPLPKQFSDEISIDKVRLLLGEALVIGTAPATGASGVAVVHALTALGRVVVNRGYSATFTRLEPKELGSPKEAGAWSKE